MALQKALAGVDFGVGLDQQTDYKITAKLTAINNARFDKSNRLSKRFGHLSTGAETLNYVRMMKRQEVPIAIEKQADALEGIPTVKTFVNGAWYDKSYILPIPQATTNYVIKSGNELNICDAFYSSGKHWISYEDQSSNRVKIAIQPDDSTESLQSSSLIAINSTRPRVGSFSNSEQYVYYGYVSGAALTIRRYDTTTNLSSVFLGIPIYNTTPNWDWIFWDNGVTRYIFIVRNTTAAQITLTRVDMAAATVSASMAEFANNAICLNIPTPNTDDINILWDNVVAAEVKHARYSAATMVQQTAPNIVFSITAGETVTQLAAINKQGTFDFLTLREIRSAAYQNRISIGSCSRAGSAIGDDYTVAASLCAKPYRYGDIANSKDALYFGASYTASNVVQKRAFLMQVMAASGQQQAFPVASVFDGESGGAVDRSILPNIYKIDDTKIAYAHQVARIIYITAAGATTSTGGVGLAKFELDQYTGYNYTEIDDAVIFSAGYPAMYDGNNISEQSFMLTPGIQSATAVLAGGSKADGVYQVLAVWEWYDANGRLHRSAPSTPVSVTISGGAGAARIDVRCHTLNLTLRNDVFGDRDITPTKIAYYCTEANGTIFYRESLPGANSLDACFFSTGLPYTALFQCTTSNTDIIAREILYTTGGELENAAVDAPVGICSTQDRLFVSNGSSVFYTKPLIDGEGISFGAGQFKPITTMGGNITALESMDDKIIVFKQNYVYFFAGRGPDATGQFDQFSECQMISDEIGAVNQAGVKLTPKGVIFKSTKGYWLVGRDLGLNYIGAEIEDYSASACLRIDISDDYNEVRIIQNTGGQLRYDYYFGQWSVDDGVPANDVVVANRIPYFASSVDNGGVFQEDKDTYTDSFAADAAYSMLATTGWIKLAGLQGFQRVWRLLLLGDFYDNHTLRINVAYDYEDSYDSIDYEITGTDATIGGSAYQARIHLRRQKCEAIKIRIMDINPTGEDLSINNITLEVGVKKGAYKLRAEKSI